MFKADEYFRRFKDLPPIVLSEPVSEEQVVEAPAVDDNPRSIDVTSLSTLDKTILQLKTELHPDHNVPGIGLFAVLVQQRLVKYVCLADIETRVRQWQMKKWERPV